MDRRSIKDAIAKAGAAGSARTRHAELLILCARIDFNP
jgi:hypothetical protein